MTERLLRDTKHQIDPHVQGAQRIVENTGVGHFDHGVDGIVAHADDDHESNLSNQIEERTAHGQQFHLRCFEKDLFDDLQNLMADNAAQGHRVESIDLGKRIEWDRRVDGEFLRVLLSTTGAAFRSCLIEGNQHDDQDGKRQCD